MSLYSSSEERFHTLAKVPASLARSFLVELANLRDEPDAGIKFRKRFRGLCPLPGPARHDRLIQENIERTPGSRPIQEQIDLMLDNIWIQPLREALRILWTSPDVRTKEWGVYRILDEVVVRENDELPYLWPQWELPRTVTCLPMPTPFEMALRYLLRVSTSVCANSECPAPYFFPTRKGQKYCSDACALPAQQEFKRKWWAEHGEAWRKKRVRRKRRKK